MHVSSLGLRPAIDKGAARLGLQFGGFPKLRRMGLVKGEEEQANYGDNKLFNGPVVPVN